VRRAVDGQQHGLEHRTITSGWRPESSIRRGRPPDEGHSPVADGMSGRAGPTGRIAPTAWPEHSPSTRFRTRCSARGVQCSVRGGVTALALRHPAPQPWSTGCSRHGSAAVYFGCGRSSRRRRPATHPGLSSMEHPDSSPALPDLWTCGDPVRWRRPRRPGAGPRRRRHAALTWRRPGDRPEDPAGVRGPGAVRRPVPAQARLPGQLRAASLLDSPRIVKQVDYAPRWRGHSVMIQASADLDDERRSWLQEAHDVVGLQADLPNRAARRPRAGPGE
jgi:hypothetical protein